jgi:DNA-binding winged helix-turn-helix (wHTH) protein/cytochrome c-type biogenesis protein CcmH/NrfG
MTYAFGPFLLDAHSRRLTYDGEPVPLPDRHVEILILLASRAGQVVSKDALIEAAWLDVAVTDNSLEQAISNVRRALAERSADIVYIETLARRGYRFAAPVTRQVGRLGPDAIEAMLAPHRAFVEGRAALETLDREGVVRACAVFEEILRIAPDSTPAHLGLANALALSFESTRAGATSDKDALARGLHHAAEACRLDPSSGEAWAALGLVCHLARRGTRAVAAAQRAIALEPDNWRHQLRLAYVSWGEERLRAADRALRLLPGLALAHWLAATVYVARGAFAEAEEQLVTAAAAQDRQPEVARFGAVGSHLLLGLLRLATGNEAAAVERLERELSTGSPTHIYRREACATTWCALGAIRLRHRDEAGALDAFDRAAAIVPGHVGAVAGRAALASHVPSAERRHILEQRVSDLRAEDAVVEAAVAEATYETLVGRPAAAAELVRAALEVAPLGQSGWVIPVDPLLHVAAHPAPWDPVLTMLRNRAA